MSRFRVGISFHIFLPAYLAQSFIKSSSFAIVFGAHVTRGKNVVHTISQRNIRSTIGVPRSLTSLLFFNFICKRTTIHFIECVNLVTCQTGYFPWWQFAVSLAIRPALHLTIGVIALLLLANTMRYTLKIGVFSQSV